MRNNLITAIKDSVTTALAQADLKDVSVSEDADKNTVTLGGTLHSNEAKQQMLGVPASTLRDHGAVSRQTAEAMARGALGKADADLVVAITGIAGPGGGSPDKPVGLVHFATASRNGRLVHAEMRYGDVGRAEVRHKSVLQALTMLQELAETK